MQKVGLPKEELRPYMWQRFLPPLLDLINSHEHDAGRPLLSAVVVNKETDLPGDGFFFRLSARPFLVPAGATEEEKKVVHKEELKQVYKCWSKGSFVEKYEAFAERHFDRVWEILDNTASKRQTITYGNLVREANLPAGQQEMQFLYVVLCKINLAELATGMPMLSAVMVRAADGWPSDSFYICAQTLGRLEEGANRETRENFWSNELRRVHEMWAELAEQVEEGEA